MLHRLAQSSPCYKAERTSLHLKSSLCKAPRVAPPRTCCPRQVTVRSSSAPSSSQSYNDTITDLMFIALCRMAYGNLAGWQSQKKWTDGEETYSGMVEVSRALMRRYANPSDQRDAVIRGFPEVPAWFRKVFPYRCGWCCWIVYGVSCRPCCAHQPALQTICASHAPCQKHHTANGVQSSMRKSHLRFSRGWWDP